MQAQMPPSQPQMPPQMQGAQMQMPPQMPPQPNVMMPFAVPSSQFPQQVQPPPFAMQPDPFGPPQAMPMPSVMQPQALGGMWQQMSPLLQADNLALKYDGKIRTTMHQQFLMALADQILDSTTWNSLLSALNGFRMQNVRVLQQPVGPTAVQKQDVKFNGEEAMILSQLVQSGTYDRLKSTPILAMYEYFLTIDDYCMKCAELSEKCVRHLLAVRRQGLGGPATVMVETSDEGRLLPQRMSEEDLNVHKTQVPPPDFLLWAIRDLIPKYGKRRFENALDTSDKLAGLEGVMHAQFDSGLTYVHNPTDYKDAMGDFDQKLYADGKQKIQGKTPYQRCVDEAALLSHSYYNDYAAICEGLFKVHILSGVRRLHAPDTKNWDENALIQIGNAVLKKDGLDAVPNAKRDGAEVGEALKVYTGGTPITHFGKIAPSLLIEEEPVLSDSLAQPGDWINACDNDNPSGSGAGAGLLQPKPVLWREYGDNHIRKVIGHWTGQLTDLDGWRRTTYVQTLPRNGGAIGEWFGANVSSTTVIQGKPTKGAARPTDPPLFKWTIHRNLKSAEEAKQKAAAFANSWLYWSGKGHAREIASAPVEQRDIMFVAAPFPFGVDLAPVASSTDATCTHLATALAAAAEAGKPGNGVELDNQPMFARTRARRVTRDAIWARAASLLGHPIQHMKTLGTACAKVHFDNWLKRNYLFPLIRIFNEVCSDHADAELNCPPSTEAYPVVSKDGNLYAAPASQVGVLDPTTGRMTFPSASASASRCVLPGATPPPPVPGLAQQVGVDRQYAAQLTTKP